MGFFSWKCAKSGVEITSPHAGTPTWTQEIVLLRERRPPEFGIYDGYGRLCTEDGDVIDFWEELNDSQPGVEFDDLMQPRLVLERFYCGENYEDVRPSAYGEWQGYFLPEDYKQQAEELARVCEAGVQHTPNPRKYLFFVTVAQVNEDKDLDQEDAAADLPGTYAFNTYATSRDDALDQFHAKVPVSCLEDYDITAKFREATSEEGNC